MDYRRNPDDFITPTSIFARAAKHLTSIEQSLKQYNMKSDLRFTGFKSNTEVFGPTRVKLVKERAPRARKIIDVKIEGDRASDL